jgi:hypothetical protein
MVVLFLGVQLWLALLGCESDLEIKMTLKRLATANQELPLSGNTTEKWISSFKVTSNTVQIMVSIPLISVCPVLEISRSGSGS